MWSDCSGSRGAAAVLALASYALPTVFGLGGPWLLPPRLLQPHRNCGGGDALPWLRPLQVSSMWFLSLMFPTFALLTCPLCLPVKSGHRSGALPRSFCWWWCAGFLVTPCNSSLYPWIHCCEFLQSIWPSSQCPGPTCPLLLYMLCVGISRVMGPVFESMICWFRY